MKKFILLISAFLLVLAMPVKAQEEAKKAEVKEEVKAEEVVLEEVKALPDDVKLERLKAEVLKTKVGLAEQLSFIAAEKKAAEDFDKVMEKDLYRKAVSVDVFNKALSEAKEIEKVEKLEEVAKKAEAIKEEDFEEEAFEEEEDIASLKIAKVDVGEPMKKGGATELLCHWIKARNMMAGAGVAETCAGFGVELDVNSESYMKIAKKKQAEAKKMAEDVNLEFAKKYKAEYK